MRTTSVFKFFAVLLLFTGLCCFFPGEALVLHQIKAGNLHPIPDFPQPPLAVITSNPPDSLPIPMLEGLPQEPASDTLPQPERKRGSATILDARIDYSATDTIRFSIRNQVVYLYGDAEVKYQNIHLKSAYIAIDFRRKELFATGLPDSLNRMSGYPIFQEGAQSFESKELRYNFETRRGRTVNVITEEADGFMHGDVVKIMENKVVHVKDGKYTTCDNPEPHFHISFRKAKILPNDKIITSLAFLTIEGIPTPLFVPFGFFPNKRGQASGILMPSYGESNNRGFYLENGGFYWGINDYVDLSLRGDIYSRGSWAARMGSTYRVRYRYSGNLNLTYAINILGEENLPGYERFRDFRVMWNHSQDPKARPNSVFQASVNAGSSQSNRFNPVSANDYLNNELSSNVSYSARWAGKYNFSANLRHHQNTSTRMVTLGLPEIAFSVNRFYPLRRKNPIGELRWYENITMNYNMNARNEIRVPDSLLFDSGVWSQMRNGMQHTIPLSHSFRVMRYFNLSNSINYSEKWYLQSIEKGWDPELERRDAQGNLTYGGVVTDTLRGFTPVRDLSFSSSLNTRLYGMVQFKKGPVRALRHVVSPSLGVSLRPDFSDPFWGYYKKYYDFSQQRNVAYPAVSDVPLDIIRSVYGLNETQYAIFEGSLYGGPSPGRSGALNFSLTNNLEMKVRSKKDTVKGERKIALIDNFTVSSGYDFARDSLNLQDIRLSGRTRLFDKIDLTYSSSWTPYDVDTLNRKINRFLWDTQGQLLKMNNTNWSVNLSYSLDSKSLSKGGAAPSAGTASGGRRSPGAMGAEGLDGGMEEPARASLLSQPHLPGEIDFSVPWSFRFSYSFSHDIRLNQYLNRRDKSTMQSLSFSGDLNLTPKWRLGMSSGYNFDQKQFTYTSVDIYRDLHCWELTINWIPFGFRQSYNMTLRVKSSVLQDLKINRRTHFLDRGFN